MKEHADFALLLDEYARLKTKHEQLQSERKWLLSQVKSKQEAFSKVRKELERLKANIALGRQQKQPGKKSAIGDWADRTLYIISVCFIPTVWVALLLASIGKARWDLNGWALLAIFLIVTPLSVFLASQHNRQLQWERQRLERLYQHKAAAPVERVSEAKEPAEKQRGKTPRRITEKSRVPITRKLTEEELAPIANAL